MLHNIFNLYGICNTFMLVLFRLPWGLLLLSLLLPMPGCMDVQGVVAQNGTIPPIQTVSHL